MDIVFLGSGEFGLPTLRHLASEHSVHAVVTQPDRPAGRGGQLTPTPIAAWAEEHLPGVPVLKPGRINEPEVVDRVRAFPADAWVVIAFGQKLGRELAADRFAINLHASLLPRWRGAAPIHAAILAGDALTGNSVITLADRMDAGLVLGRSERVVERGQTAGELHDLLAADGPELVERVLSEHRAGSLRPQTQDEAMVTIAPKLSRADGWIDFSASAEDCQSRVHGLTPWPGVTVSFRDAPLKLLRVRLVDGPSPGAEPGTVIDGESGHVACGSGTVLELAEVQPPGKRAMSWADFSRGRVVKAGERFAGRADAP